MNIKFLSFVVLISLVVACKSDNKTANAQDVEHTVVLAPSNDTTALAGTGVKDVSDVYNVDPNQPWPEVNSFMLFKNNGVVKTYLDETLRGSVDFANNDMLAIIMKKVEYGVTFKVESIDTKSSPIKINLKSIKNNEIKSSHRPGFMLSLPKNLAATEPVILLDSVLVGGMTFN
jgi:hypothetical protein